MWYDSLDYSNTSLLVKRAIYDLCSSGYYHSASLNQRVEQISNHPRALLRGALLAVLIVNIGHAKPCEVALSPFKVTD